MDTNKPMLQGTGRVSINRVRPVALQHFLEEIRERIDGSGKAIIVSYFPQTLTLRL